VLMNSERYGCRRNLRQASPLVQVITAESAEHYRAAILDHPKNPWNPCPWFTRDYSQSPSPS
jgi:hypothetical protein